MLWDVTLKLRWTSRGLHGGTYQKIIISKNTALGSYKPTAILLFFISVNSK
jgi:hypothetical protein